MPTINRLRIGNEEYTLNTRICLKRMTYDQFYDKINKEDKSYYKVNDGVYIDRNTWETVLIYDITNVISKENTIWDEIIDFN